MTGSSFWDCASAWTDASWCCGQYEADASSGSPYDLARRQSAIKKLLAQKSFGSEFEITNVDSNTTYSSCDDSSHGGDEIWLRGPNDGIVVIESVTTDAIKDEHCNEFGAELSETKDIELLANKTGEFDEPSKYFDAAFAPAQAPTCVLSEGGATSNQSGRSSIDEMLSQLPFARSFTSEQPPHEDPIDLSSLSEPKRRPIDPPVDGIMQNECIAKDESDDLTTVRSKDEVSIELALTKTLWKDCWFVAAHDTILESSSTCWSEEEYDNEQKGQRKDELDDADDHGSSTTSSLYESARQGSLQELLEEQIDPSVEHVTETVSPISKPQEATMYEGDGEQSLVLPPLENIVASGDLNHDSRIADIHSHLAAVPSEATAVTSIIESEEQEGNDFSTTNERLEDRIKQLSKARTDALSFMLDDGSDDDHAIAFDYAQLPLIPDKASGTVKKKSFRRRILGKADYWKKLEVKTGFIRVDPSKLTLAPVAKIARETKYANVSKRSSYNGEVFSMPMMHAAANDVSQAIASQQQRSKPTSLGVGEMGSEQLDSQHLTLGFDRDDETASFASRASVSERSTSPSQSDSESDSDKGVSSSDDDALGRRYAITSDMMVLVSGKSAPPSSSEPASTITNAQSTVNKLEPDTLNALFSNWCKLQKPEHSATVDRSPSKMRIVKSITVDASFDASDVRSLLTHGQTNFGDLMQDVMDAVYCIYSFLLLLLAPLTFVSVICLVWALMKNDVRLHNALVPFLEKFTFFFQANFVVTCILGAKLDSAATVLDCLGVLAAPVLEAYGYSLHIREDELDAVRIIAFSTFLVFITVRGWQLATRESSIATTSAGNDQLGSLEVVWNCKSARLVLMILPELEDIYQEAWGLECTTSVCCLTLIVSDVDRSACRVLEKELKESALYKRGCVRYLRRPNAGVD